MKPVCLLLLAIVLAITCAMGQDTVLHRNPYGVSSNSQSLNLYPYSMDRCPIGLQVNHGSLFLQRKVEYGPGSNGGIPLTGSVQRIHLIMTNPNPREIVKVQLTVHGYSDKWKAIPLVRASSAPDLAKEVTVVLDIQGNGHPGAHLRRRPGALDVAERVARGSPFALIPTKGPELGGPVHPG